MVGIKTVGFQNQFGNHEEHEGNKLQIKSFLIYIFIHRLISQLMKMVLYVKSC